MSPSVKPTGASEKVKVTFELLSVSDSAVSTMSMVTVGFLVSIVTVSGVAASLALSAASVNLPASTVTEPWPSKPSSAGKGGGGWVASALPQPGRAGEGRGGEEGGR